MNRFGEVTEVLAERFKEATGGLTIGGAIGLYVFALFLLDSIHGLLHDRGSGGIWWSAFILALLFRGAYSFGRFRGEQKQPRHESGKPDKEFNLPL